MGEPTLGPWTVGPYQKVEHGLVAPAHAYPVMGKFGKVAFVIGSEEEARLIAAAPDLLAALEGMLAGPPDMITDDYCPEHEDSGGLCNHIHRARAAIRKARGSETPAP